jgi:uracil-DNA glycosylase
MRKHEIADSHLTDVIKARGRVADPYPDMAVHRRFFDKELDIVRPAGIICFGTKVHDMLRFALAHTGIRITRINHYTYLRYYGRRPEEKARFAREMRNAIRELGQD